MNEKVVTAEQMKRIDQHAIQEIGIPSMVLMERAALSVTDEILSDLAPEENILVVCGTGNNGGDGIAIARMLYLKGKRVTVALLGEKEKMSPETKLQLDIAEKIEVPTLPVQAIEEWLAYTHIMDSLFGIGLNRNVEGSARKIIEQINHSDARVIAVDIASGFSASAGKILNTVVYADQTITFGFKKKGMDTEEGKRVCGEIIVKEIGYPKQSVQYGMTGME